MSKLLLIIMIRYNVRDAKHQILYTNIEYSFVRTEFIYVM
jgi:hypothetical protein